MSAKLEVRKAKIIKFEGAIAAAATPFDENGKLDTSQISKYARHLVKIGAKGVYILGTTGEGLSLSIHEKLEVVRAWRFALDDCDGQLTAIVHITSTVMSEMQRMAVEVDKLRFDAIAVLPSLYYKNATIDWLVGYLACISESAPDIPLYYYYSPKATGELPFELDRFVGKALERVPQLAGLKFADTNIANLERLVSLYSDRLNIMPGTEFMLLAAAAFGCKAANCTLFSFADDVEAFHTIQAAFSSGGSLVDARIAQRKINVKRETWGTGAYYLKVLKDKLNLEPATGGLFVGKARPPICFD